MGGKQRGANRGFWDKGTVSKERMESHSEPLLNMAEREADVCDGKPREAPRVHESRQEEARRQPQAAATCSQSSQSLIPADVNGRMSLVDMVRSLKAAGTTSRLLPCGGIEAVPRLSGDDVATRLSQSGLDSLPRLLNGRADRSAITGIKSGVGSGACSVCHGQLLEFVKRGGGLSECGVSVGDRVGVLLPNGPEMAVCLLTCMASCVAMPINHQMTVSEVISELSSNGAAAVISQAGEDDELICAEAAKIGVKVILLTPSVAGNGAPSGLFTLSVASATATGMSGGELSRGAAHRSALNSLSDTALLLHTSGTSGTKKAVPYTLSSLLVGAACIIESWGIEESDVCINMMPLFHVGGIVRNLLAPVLSGGTVACARGFDPALFWEACVDQRVTWYYAGPTMHQLLLDELGESGRPPTGCCITKVFNASGGLSHGLATQLRNSFGCFVMPSYGMTECMPISTPPVGYSLDRPGTSGVMCGPRARVYDSNGQVKKPGEVGSVCLQGAPLMEGYLGKKTDLVDGGWFDTGDTGYIDDQGWLYITGRSKEVINRGGEIISPFEVEEALMTHDRVKAVLAFSAPHDLLQEVVGCLVVPEPGKPRIDLIGLQKFAANVLHPSKWPQVLVFIDELPKAGATGKTLRINVAPRCGIGAVKETQAQTQRMFEARAPPPGSGLDVSIPTRAVGIDLQEVMRVMRLVQGRHGVGQCVVISGHHEHRKDAVCAYVTPKTVDVDALTHTLKEHLHDYLVPIEIVTLDSLPNDPGGLPLPALKGLLREHINPRTATEVIIQDVWTFVLGGELPSVHADFFEKGGTSLLAGRLIAKVRGVLGVPMTAASIFQCRTIAALAAKADEMGAVCPSQYKRLVAAGKVGPEPDGTRGMSPSPDNSEEAEDVGKSVWGGRQTRATALIVQALPLFVLYPFRRILTWVVFVVVWLFVQSSMPIHRLEALVLALIIERMLAEAVLPLLAVAVKWLVIGRYREGSHQLWSNYYLRWWIVDQALLLFGRGMFRHSQLGLKAYYRLMGAKIGRNVVLDHRVRIAEFDLVSIGDDCLIDDVTVRAFCLEGCRMRLNSVRIGARSSICTKVSVAPGINIPAGTNLGPLSSSYAVLQDDCPPSSNRTFCRQAFPEPPWYLMAVGYLILAVVFAAQQLPLLLVLRSMCLQSWYVPVLRNFGDVLAWFLTPGRMGFYVALRIVRAVVQPSVRVIMGVLIKKLFIGRFTPGPRNRSVIQVWKHWLMAKVLPSEALHEALQLIGAHYGGVTFVMRLLGAKCGERIYWPGSGFAGLVEYDLLEVGDDVIFGSRSVLMCCDGEDAMKIEIKEGANVADRCVLLPGCTLERNALLGSGGLGGKGQTLQAGSKWVGSRHGSAVMLEAGSDAAARAPTLRPFGKAFHLGEAPYRVMSAFEHALVACLSRAFAVSYRALALFLALLLTSIMLQAEGKNPDEYNFGDIFNHLVPLYVFCQNAATILALVIAILSKWLILGRRQAGEFDWDQSSYCQRWNVYLTVTCLIRNAYFGRGLLEYIQGSVYLVWYFRSLGARIGKDTCLYPTGGDPMMTEPELVQLGNETSVDRASLVAHINSLGRFSLNPVIVGARATLRSDSRLLSGATMLSDSTLLEHTLILGGDVVDQGSTWQGWPGQMIAMSNNRRTNEQDAEEGFVEVQPPADESGGRGMKLGVELNPSSLMSSLLGQDVLASQQFGQGDAASLGASANSSLSRSALAARGRGIWASSSPKCHSTVSPESRNDHQGS